MSNHANCSPRVLVVEDDPSLREAVCDTISLAGYQVLAAEDGMAALTLLKQPNIGMVLSDIRMPNMDGNTLLRSINELYPNLPVLMMTAFGTVKGAVQAIQEGAVDYIVKPFEPETLISQIKQYLCPTPDINMIGEDPNTQRLMNLALRVAKSDSTVMITGPSGSGKEVLARYIHDNSARANKPFVAINCAAIPENMLEATLFGYEKGAYTGAHQARAGTFEQAQGGTLLLDEITEMDLGLQAKLLRVIQEREIERLGGRGRIKLDVRILATSNRDMAEAISENKLREDLYFRLNVFPMHLLPLKQRPGDILPLARKLLQNIAQHHGRAVPQFSTEADAALLRHEWPGNVRELGNLVERVMVLQNGNIIEVDDLLFEHLDLHHDPLTTRANTPIDSAPDDAPAEPTGLRAHERDMILQTLRDLDGKRSATAKKLGISPRTLRYKIARMRDQGIGIPGH